mmetsp:Transcript_34213/g.96982  ORF Transcript_34213/g.96982 Transcript_34213/m.96982 type:complete len:402 (+) Transcript_34213:451-1656(+)
MDGPRMVARWLHPTRAVAKAACPAATPVNPRPVAVDLHGIHVRLLLLLHAPSSRSAAAPATAASAAHTALGGVNIGSRSPSGASSARRRGVLSPIPWSFLPSEARPTVGRWSFTAAHPTAAKATTTRPGPTAAAAILGAVVRRHGVSARHPAEPAAHGRRAVMTSTHGAAMGARYHPRCRRPRARAVPHRSTATIRRGRPAMSQRRAPHPPWRWAPPHLAVCSWRGRGPARSAKDIRATSPSPARRVHPWAGTSEWRPGSRRPSTGIFPSGAAKSRNAAVDRTIPRPANVAAGATLEPSEDWARFVSSSGRQRGDWPIWTPWRSPASAFFTGGVLVSAGSSLVAVTITAPTGRALLLLISSVATATAAASAAPPRGASPVLVLVSLSVLILVFLLVLAMMR